MTTTIEQNESNSKRAELLKQLEKQLIYYYSSHNLSKDVYLQTIMNLNSGHVPISILANFSNVNKIIGKSGVLQQYLNKDNDSTEDKTGETGGSDSSSEQVSQGDISTDKAETRTSSSSAVDEYTTQIYDLLQEAAQESTLLSVVSLNQYGNVVDEDSVKRQNDEDGSNRIRTIVAIGPSTEFNGVVPEEYTTEQVDNEAPETIQSRRNSTNSSHVDANKSNVIILRDVHCDATENDIRQLFQESHIHNVNKEIGNCWFVALNNISQQDVIEVMQSLRDKSVCDEPIKARLKTQSSASSSQTGEAVYQQNSYYGRNPYYRNGGARYKGGVGSQYSNASRGYVNHYSNQIYFGDRAAYASKKYARGSFGAGSFEESSGGYKKRFHRDGKGATHANTTEETKVAKTQEPPPPVGEEHYPSLSGSDGDSSPTSVALATSNVSGFGYAAALMKESPHPPVEATVDTKPAVTHVPAPKKVTNKNDITRMSSSSSTGKTTTLTLSTDDASSDEKSSLSSKPESESFIGTGAVTAPATVWSGGKSFADILKK